jgi:hypothetical protein
VNPNEEIHVFGKISTKIVHDECPNASLRIVALPSLLATPTDLPDCRANAYYASSDSNPPKSTPPDDERLV